MRRFLTVFFLFMVSGACAQPQFTKDVLDNPKKHASVLESAFHISNILQFVPFKRASSVVLENGYASSRITNPGDWNGENKVIDTVKIIFTNYPVNKSFWLTDYHQLLAGRLESLFEIDPGLNSKKIAYEILLQLGCKTDSQARNMFHGFEIVFHAIKPAVPEAETKKDQVQVLPDPENTEAPVVNTDAKRISSFINSNGGLIDSTVINVLERHREWKKALVIMDWTGSMYPYGGQAVLWHSLNFKSSGLKYFVFFNDGNNETRKKIGRTGGIYFEKAENIKKLVNLLNKVKLKGNGGDTEENDLEAIIKGMQKYPDFDQVILIADNNSCIRDFCLIHEINVPVKIILCGAYAGINPQFLNLAYKTNGSVHTIEEDIYDLYARKNSDASWMIDGTEYRFNAKKDLFEYVVTPDKDDPHFCEPFYRKKKCKCEKLK